MVGALYSTVAGFLSFLPLSYLLGLPGKEK
jgi:hypothetical protein